MNFGQALQALNAGLKIKVPEWGGYWFKEAGMVKVMTAKGEVLETPHLQQYIFRTDWGVIVEGTTTSEKSLHNTTANGAKKNVKDIQFWGDGDLFKLIAKASSESEGWMKSTKAMPVGNKVVIQVTTQQRNQDGSYSVAEALTTVENAIIVEFKDGEDKVDYRAIVERRAEHEGCHVFTMKNVEIEKNPE